MDRQKLLKYLDDPATLNGSSLAELQELVRQFPYFSAAQILLAKNFHNLESVHYNKQLKLASAYSFDRKLLYSVIMENDKAPLEVEVAESKFDENNKTVEQELSVAELQEVPVPKVEEELIEEKVVDSKLSESFIVVTEAEKTFNPNISDEEVSKEEMSENDTTSVSPLSPREIIENRLREITGGRDEQRATDTSSEVRDKSKPDPDLTNVLNPTTGIQRSSDPIETPENRERTEVAFKDPIDKESLETTLPVIDEFKSKTDTDVSNEDFKTVEDRIEITDEERAEVEIEAFEKPEELIPDTDLSAEASEQIEEEDLIPELEQTILEELPVTMPVSSLITKDEPVEEERITDHHSETHSFSDWLKLSKRSADDENTELINIRSKSENDEDQVEEDLDISNMKAPILPANKAERTKIIDKFIQEEPRIEQGKTSFFSPMNMARKSVVEHDDIYSETLAKIYDKQGNYLRALKMYEKLRLKYPEKSTSFAAQITRLRSLIESQDN